VKTEKKSPRYTIDVTAGANGRVGKATIRVRNKEDRTTVFTDQANLTDARESQKAGERAADKLDLDPEKICKELVAKWNRTLDDLDRKKEEEAEQAAKENKDKESAPETLEERSERLFKEMPQEVQVDAENVLQNPKLISRTLADVEAMGVAGEKTLALTTYLVGTSRLLARPLAGLVRGPTASGKSYVIERTTRLFPPEAVLLATSLTPQSLYYLPPGSLQHRLIVAGERSRRQDDEVADATKPIREMLSSGRLSKLIPIKGEEGLESVLIEQEGPIAYLESTTRERIFDEDENRLLSIYTDERSKQTRKIITRLASDAAGGVGKEADPIILRHFAMQRLLRRREIVIPYAQKLGGLIPEERVEARRAFPHLLSMIQASALLHQFQRQADDQGRIIATGEDYELARKLMLKPLTRLLGESVSEAALRFLDRLKKWNRSNLASFTTVEVRNFEKHSKPAVWGWLRELADAGLVELVEEGRGRKPASWKLTKRNKSSDLEILPSLEDVLQRSLLAFRKTHLTQRRFATFSRRKVHVLR
jgi:hypothetical protein